MRVLLLSAYDAASHRRWREGLVAQFPEHDWQALTLPARHFAWRIRGNGLMWACGERDVLTRGYDLVVATSMVDLATLRGLVPALASVPAITYFHENQFAYPVSERQVDSIEPQMVNLYSALAADKVGFNSDYNRRTFLEGVDALFVKLPDTIPDGVVSSLEGKATVLPVALEAECYSESRKSEPGPLHLIWNHRWEYDKGPERLLAIVERLLERGVDFELSVLGERFRREPEAFAALRERLGAPGGRLRHFGYIESINDYRAYLRTGDVVLSTALHEYQGLATLEAVAAGCVPLVPDRLCYPEWFDNAFRYASWPDDAGREADRAVTAIERLATAKAAGDLPAAPSVDSLGWSAMRPRYAALLSEVATR